MTQYFVQDRALNYAKKNEYSLINYAHSRTLDSAIQVDSLLSDYSGISISEIYASPFPKSSKTDLGDWKNEEWIEIRNFSQHAVDLSGLDLATSKSVKPLPEGLKIASGSMLIFRTHQIGLSLRNDGDIVNLVRKDGSIIGSIEYPALKNGISFSILEDHSCITIQPTPGLLNACIDPILKVAKTKTSTSKKQSKKSSTRVQSYAASYRAQEKIQSYENTPILLTPASNRHSWLLFCISLVIGMALPLGFGLYLFFSGILSISFKSVDTLTKA
jgi:hypothetical protein